MTMLKRLLGATAACGLLLTAPMAASAAGKTTSVTHHKDGYTITLKLLPAEPWTKDGASTPHGEMQRLGGAKPLTMASAVHPNHHLIVFLKKNGHPVENAHVAIRYKGPRVKHTNWNQQKWTKEPVVRMDVSGKGAKSTHYGNNVLLKAGTYLIDVKVNNKVDSRFHLSVH